MDLLAAFLAAIIVCFAYLALEFSVLLWVINLVFETQLKISGESYFGWCVLRMIQGNGNGIMTLHGIKK